MMWMVLVHICYIEMLSISPRMVYVALLHHRCFIPYHAMCICANMIYILHSVVQIWGWVKTLYPCSSPQNSWDLWMFIPLKMVLIGIDPYPYV